MTARVCGKSGKRAVCGLRVTANALTARICGKGAENVPFAVLRVKANIFLLPRAFAAEKRQTCRLRFCTLRRMLLLPRVCGKSGKRAACGFALYDECFCYRAFAAKERQMCRLRFCTLRQIFFITAHVCGKGEVNVPFAVLHVKANAFVTARLRKKRKTCRLRFCTLRRMLLLPRVCGKGEANVPLAVLHVKANIFYYRARLRQRRSKRAVCGFAR